MNQLIATFFYIGKLRPAPGTWGSLATVILAVILYEAGLPYAVPVLCALATVLGFWVLPKILKSREDDPSEVVIDEVAGQALALSFTVIPLANHNVEHIFLGAWPGWVVPFLLFRLFDIWKPWIIGKADRRGGTVGVMLDDLLAGLFAGLGSCVLAGLYHALIQPMLG